MPQEESLPELEGQLAFMLTKKIVIVIIDTNELEAREFPSVRILCTWFEGG